MTKNFSNLSIINVLLLLFSFTKINYIQGDLENHHFLELKKDNLEIKNKISELMKKQKDYFIKDSSWERDLVKGFFALVSVPFFIFSGINFAKIDPKRGDDVMLFFLLPIFIGAVSLGCSLVP